MAPCHCGQGDGQCGSLSLWSVWLPVTVVSVGWSVWLPVTVVRVMVSAGVSAGICHHQPWNEEYKSAVFFVVFIVFFFFFFFFFFYITTLKVNIPVDNAQK